MLLPPSKPQTLSMALSMLPCLLLSLLITILSLQPHALPSAQPTGQERVLLRESVSLSAMHAQLLHNNKVVVFDRTDFGPSKLSLPADKCREKVDEVLKVHCTAPSLLYDISSNTLRALYVQIDVWCSSASLDPAGTLLQTGGNRKIRLLFNPCDDDEECDWIELPQNLTFGRWYASDQTLPDGRVIVIGGRDSPNYEFFPKYPYDETSFTVFDLQFLNQTRDKLYEENNLYPFCSLNA